MGSVAPESSQFATAFRFQFLAYLRTWRFLGLVIFVAIISAAILAVQVHRGAETVTTNYATASDYLSGYLGYLTDAVILIGAFLGGDALAVDLAGGPGYLMLSQPVRRRTLLAGRFAAATVAGLVVGAVYYLFSIGAVLYFYGTVPASLLSSFGEAFLFLLAVLAVAFFFSSFFRNATVSLVAAILILLIGFPILTSVGTLTGVEPWYSLDYGAQSITSVLSTSFAHSATMHVSAGRGAAITLYTYSPYPWEGALIMVVYLAVFLALAFWVYRYKEVRG